MTENQQSENVGGRFGLTPEEYNDVKTLLKMAGAIFGAVAIALIIVAIGASIVNTFFGVV